LGIDPEDVAGRMHSTRSITLSNDNALELCEIVYMLGDTVTTYAINGATVNLAIELARAGVV
jgi:hypothetical protein